MKLKKTIKGIGIILALGITMSGCSFANDTIWTLEDQTIQINGVDFTLYEPLSSVLSEDGWSYDGSEEDVINNGEEKTIRLLYNHDESKALTIKVQNSYINYKSQEQTSVIDTDISYIAFQAGNEGVSCTKLPGDVKIGDPLDKLLMFQNKPYSIKSDEHNVQITYRSNYYDRYTFEAHDDQLVNVELQAVENGESHKDTTYQIDTNELQFARIETTKKGPSYTRWSEEGLFFSEYNITPNTSIQNLLEQGCTINKSISSSDKSHFTGTLICDTFFDETLRLDITLDKESEEDANVMKISTIYDDSFIHYPFEMPAKMLSSESAIVQAYGFPDEVNRELNEEEIDTQLLYRLGDERLTFKFYNDRLRTINWYVETTGGDGYDE